MSLTFSYLSYFRVTPIGYRSAAVGWGGRLRAAFAARESKTKEMASDEIIYLIPFRSCISLLGGDGPIQEFCALISQI